MDGLAPFLWAGFLRSQSLLPVKYLEIDRADKAQRRMATPDVVEAVDILRDRGLC